MLYDEVSELLFVPEIHLDCKDWKRYAYAVTGLLAGTDID